MQASARHDDAAKQLHKALDQRHKLAVSQFGKATTEQALRSIWSEAVRRGEMPSAYWAILTHPVTTQPIVREAFGEVHMLSHLVGSANRADIRRLCELEAEKAELAAKLDRQQLALRDAVVARDAQIRDLRQALAERIVSEPSPGQADEETTLRDLVTDLQRRLSVEARRRVTLEKRLTATQAVMAQERSARLAAERESDAMRRELDVAEASLAWENTGRAHDTQPEVRLDGVVLLYVGGRPNLVAQM